MKPWMLAAALGLLLSWTGPAAAAPSAAAVPPARPAMMVARRDRHHDRDRRRERRDHRYMRERRHHDRGWGDRRRDSHAWRERYPRGIAGRPHWSRGDRLYRDYWGPRYYVHDWRRYHLRRPPRGYRWVRVNGDFLLVAITTGIILDVMMNAPYR